MGESGRDECLRLTVDRLGATPTGRALGLHRLSSLRDLRASVPVDAQIPEGDARAQILSELSWVDMEVLREAVGAGRERQHVVGVWEHLLGGQRPERTALLWGELDRGLDDLLVGDLRALGGEVMRVTSMADPPGILERLEAFDPQVLVVPSLFVCRSLEAVHRAPLEVRLRSLRAVFSEHDLHRPHRSSLPVYSSGWIGPGGRIGLPTVRPPDNAVTLAVGSQIVELLPYSNPEEDARRVYAKSPVWPEDAIMSQRYEVVLTSPLGLLRTRTGEHVRVVGFDAPSGVAAFPRPRVVRLTPAVGDVRLEGCTVAGAWLTASVRQALEPQDPALVDAEIAADPGAVQSSVGTPRNPGTTMTDMFADTEFGSSLTRTGLYRVQRRHARRVLVRIELQGDFEPALTGKLAERIDANLRRRSGAYDHLRARDELSAPRVEIVEPGTRRRDQEARTAALKGRVWLSEVRVQE